MNAKARREAAIKAALDLINRVKARDGIMTDAERTELKGYDDTVKECDALIEAAKGDEDLFARMQAAGPVKSDTNDGGDAPYKAKSLGDHWAHTLKAKGLKTAKDIPSGVTVAADELVFGKAATDTQTVGGSTGAYGPMVTDVDTATGRALVDSMTNEVVVRDDAIRALVPFEPMSYDQAVRQALRERAQETDPE